MLDPNIFNTLFVIPILNILVFLYKIFLFVKIPGAFGFAIIGLTVLVRLLLHPFFKQQLDTTRKMQEIKPHLDKLSLKYKKEPQKLQQEQMKIYQQAGINPASGCLFMIIQIPVFIGLYNTLSLFLLNGQGSQLIAKVNKALYSASLHIQQVEPWFFGLNLALTPAKSGNMFYYLIPVITGILQYLQVQVTTPSAIKNPPKQEGKEIEKKPETGGDFQKAMNTQMKFIFPLMIGWFSYTLPVGLSLYWNIFSIFSLIQYKRMQSKAK